MTTCDHCGDNYTRTDDTWCEIGIRYLMHDTPEAKFDLCCECSQELVTTLMAYVKEFVRGSKDNA